MRLETYELPALGEYVHDPRTVPARHRHGFLRRRGKETSPSIINGSWKPPAVGKVN